MGDKEDKAALATALKAAKTGKMQFALILKGPADGVLLVSKSAPTGKQIAAAKAKCGGTKTVSGECYGEGEQLVFETSEGANVQWSKAVKDIAKRDTGQTIKADFRLPAAPGANPPTAQASGAAPTAAPSGFTAGQAPTRAPAKPGMLGGQRAAPVATPPTAPAPTVPASNAAPTAAPTGFTAGQAPARAPAKPGMLGAQRGAAPQADATARQQYQQSIKEVEAPLMESLKESKGDVGKMRALFQSSRKKADSGNFDLAMEDLAALRALFGSSASGAAPPKESLVDSTKGNAPYTESLSSSATGQQSYVEGIQGSPEEQESNEQESNEDQSHYVDGIDAAPKGNDSPESESQEGQLQEGAKPSKLQTTTGPINEVETPESLANAAVLAEAGREHSENLDRAAERANSKTKARERRSNLPDAIAENAKKAQQAADFGGTQHTQSIDPIDHEDISGSNEEEESEESESNEQQSAQPPKVPPPNPRKQFDQYINQFTTILNEFNAARKSYQEFRDAVHDLAVESSAEAMEIDEMIAQRVGGKDPSQVDSGTIETVNFFHMLSAAAAVPEAYIRVAAALKLPKKDKSGKVIQDTKPRDVAEQEMNKARQTAQDSRKESDAAWKEFEAKGAQLQMFRPLQVAEAAEKAAEQACEQASEAYNRANEVFQLDAKAKWDRAGEASKVAEALIKQLAASGANQNQQNEARSKAEAARQALAEARAEYDKAAKAFSEKSVIFTRARQSLSDAHSATSAERDKVEQSPDAAAAVAARKRAEDDEFQAAIAEQTFNQIAFALALENSGKENPFLTENDRGKIDAFFTKLKDMPDQHAQLEQSAAAVRNVATRMQAVKVDTASLTGSIALQQYAKKFASFARTVSSLVDSKQPLDGIESETGFDLSDMSGLKEAQAKLPK